MAVAIFIIPISRSLFHIFHVAACVVSTHVCMCAHGHTHTHSRQVTALPILRHPLPGECVMEKSSKRDACRSRSGTQGCWADFQMARLALADVWIEEVAGPSSLTMMLSFPQCSHYRVEFSGYLIQREIFGQALWLTSDLGRVKYLPVWLLLLRKEIRLWIQEYLHRSLIAHKLSSVEKACLFRTHFLTMRQEWKLLGMPGCLVHCLCSVPTPPV